MHAVEVDYTWIGNVEIVHAENCCWTVGWKPVSVHSAFCTSCKDDYHCMCTHTASSHAHITCAYAHSHVNKNLLIASMFNIMTFMLLQGTCCSREYILVLLFYVVCQSSNNVNQQRAYT